MDRSANPVTAEAARQIPTDIMARATPTMYKTLTKLAVSEGADCPSAWLRMRTRLDVSAEAGHACPATGFGRRYLPVGVEKKKKKGVSSRSMTEFCRKSGQFQVVFLHPSGHAQ